MTEGQPFSPEEVRGQNDALQYLSGNGLPEFIRPELFDQIPPEALAIQRFRAWDTRREQMIQALVDAQDPTLKRQLEAAITKVTLQRDEELKNSLPEASYDHRNTNSPHPLLDRLGNVSSLIEAAIRLGLDRLLNPEQIPPLEALHPDDLEYLRMSALENREAALLEQRRAVQPAGFQTPEGNTAQIEADLNRVRELRNPGN